MSTPINCSLPRLASTVNAPQHQTPFCRRRIDASLASKICDKILFKACHNRWQGNFGSFSARTQNTAPVLVPSFLIITESMPRQLRWQLVVPAPPIAPYSMGGGSEEDPCPQDGCNAPALSFIPGAAPDTRCVDATVPNFIFS